MSLSAERNTMSRTRHFLSVSVAANVLIYAGALVCLTATGFATPGAAIATLRGAGRASETKTNVGGQDGDTIIQVETGTFLFNNSAGADEITNAQRYQMCYVEDDETVAKTNGGATRGPAGFIIDVDDRGVWVLLGEPLPQALAGGMLAANNGSDAANVATFRANICANKLYVPVHAADLKAADGSVYGFVAPCVGTITKVLSSLQGHALATGDATLTGKIGAVAITNGVVTITQAGSAIGDKDNATPTAANVVAAGDYVTFTVGGANDNAAAFADLVVEITF